MTRKRKNKYWVGDFETTVYDGQTFTEVWAAALVEFGSEDVKIFNNIKGYWDYIVSLKQNIIIYMHNLKFDGAFLMSYFLTVLKLNQATYTVKKANGETTVKWLPEKEMQNNTFSYSISDRMGQWYYMKVKVNGKIIEFRDSYKLLPFSVENLGKGFKTKHRKTEIEYKGKRRAGGFISDKEKTYIANDVLVVKEALELMHDEGHDSLTIGACCMKEYKRILNAGLPPQIPTFEQSFDSLFPNLYEFKLGEEWEDDNAGEWIRRAYKGGWCYLVKGKENKIFTNGVTADVNSLYPSVMHSDSGNVYPFGYPTFWCGDYIPQTALETDRYYYIRVKTRFYIRKNYLPCIQVKSSLLYKPTEWLEDSDVYDYRDGKKHNYITMDDGTIQPASVELTLTMTDWELIKKHYILKDTVIIGGCYFHACAGMFDEYIDKYKQIKMNSKDGRRTIAKLYSNNLYGKFATNTDSSFKIAYVDIDNVVRYKPIIANDKKPGYIAVGAAVTSYARNFTIKAAQANYYGADKAGFIYADTDSCHMDLPLDKIKNIPEHPNEYLHWKYECQWDKAIFVRQKTYIEHVTHEDNEVVEHPYYKITCAGMPQKCKDLFVKSLEHYEIKDGDEFTELEKDIINRHYNITDFKTGLRLPGKLLPVRIPGGIVLTDTVYEMR